MKKNDREDLIAIGNIVVNLITIILIASMMFGK